MMSKHNSEQEAIDSERFAWKRACQLEQHPLCVLLLLFYISDIIIFFVATIYDYVPISCLIWTDDQRFS